MGSNNENTLYTGNLYRRLFLPQKRRASSRCNRSHLNKFVEKCHFQIENISYLKTLRKRGDFFEIRKLKGRTSFRPCTRVLTKVPVLPMKRRNICLSRPPICAKYSFQIFFKAAKTSSLLSAKERYLEDCLILGSSVEELRANTR